MALKELFTKHLLVTNHRIVHIEIIYLYDTYNFLYVRQFIASRGQKSKSLIFSGKKRFTLLFINPVHRASTKRTFGWIQAVCIFYWCIRYCQYTEFNFVLQGWSPITALELYNNLHAVWTLRHLLQWTTWWSLLSDWIWTCRYCRYGNMWTHSAR